MKFCPVCDSEQLHYDVAVAAYFCYECEFVLVLVLPLNKVPYQRGKARSLPRSKGRLPSSAARQRLARAYG